MSPARPRLLHVGPLPPARNGIADYGHALLGGLAESHDCLAAAEDLLAETPPGVRLVDPALAHRHLPPGAAVLHQLGDNRDHAFVLRLLRRLPGIAVLHDPGLLHLHHMAAEPAERIGAAFRSVIPGLAAVHARQLRRHGWTTPADHALFDLAGEVLARSSAVIVHSRFARARLSATHGAAATAHVAVIPHLIPDRPLPDRAAARARLGVPAGTFLMVTAGFANLAKRFDWVREAAALTPGLRWIHAGAADLPGVPATGFLPRPALEDHIAAADVLVNLRFPSRGESSGTLALALAAGTCAIVTDTAAYAELPREAVVHLAPGGNLAAVLAGLLAAPDRARRIGAAGQAHARAECALPAVLARYRAVLAAAPPLPPAAPAGPPPLFEAAAETAAIATALAGWRGPCRLRLRCASLAALAAFTLDSPDPLGSLLPAGARLRTVSVEPAGLLLGLDVG